MTSRTKWVAGRFAALAIVGVSIVACRAIVGIEDLELRDLHDAAAVDSSMLDSGAVDAGTVDSAAAAQIAECKAEGNACRKCCKDNFKDFRDLQNGEDARNCLCELPGTCRADCAQDGGFCTSGGQPLDNCVRCIDDAFRDHRCIGACNSAECLAGLECLQGCDTP